MNKKKIVTVLLIALPLLVGSYFIYKSFKATSPSLPNQKQPDPNAAIKTNGKIDKTKLSSGNSSFPLKVGSGSKSNPDANVKALQDILGVTIDGIFGSQTLAALQDQTGKTQVDSLDDLNNVIDQVMAQDASPTVVNPNITRSQQIINDFQANVGAKSLQALNNTTLTGYTLDTVGNQYVGNGYIMNWVAGDVYNSADYEPYDNRTDNGFLIIYCNKGANQGVWTVDPNDITLVQN